jgi:flagellar biosynthetic protein FlhB
MADADQASKTEDPTSKRRNKAFQEGQFARAPEINTAFNLAVAFCVLLFAVPGTASRIAETSIFIFGHLGEVELSASSMPYQFRNAIEYYGYLIFPFVGAAMLAGIAAGGLQTGFRLTPKVLEVKWSKLDPIKGFAKVMSKDVLIRLGIDLLKLAAIGLVLYWAVQRILDDPIFYSSVDVGHVGKFIWDTVLFVIVRIAVIAAIIAVISYTYQMRKTRKDLMMTKQEVKDERKQAEIDPQIKSARRALAMRIMQRQMLDAVPTADVVVTNPTHFAVALKYERGKDRAPVVLAKGRDIFARRIKTLASQHGVPFVENKPVARALFKYGQVGREIPAQLYQVVAEILSFVYRTHRYYFHRLKARRMGQIA